MIEFFIPGVPVPKGRPKFTVRGGFAKAYTPAKTRDYENMVKSIAQKSISRPLEGPLCVSIVATFNPAPSLSNKARQSLLNQPHTKRPDLDNIVKILTDSLNGLAYTDDSQIAELHARKVYGVDVGVSVEISSM